MKFYKEEIKRVKPVDALLREHYHVWTPESIEEFWIIWANNVHLRRQFYPKEYFLNFFKQVKDSLREAEYIVDVGCGSGTVLSVLDELGFGLIRFFYPMNTNRPSSLAKYIIKNKILIPLFPKVARRLFPMPGVTGFGAQKMEQRKQSI